MNRIIILSVFLILSSSFGRESGYNKPEKMYFSLTLDYGMVFFNGGQVKKTYYSTTPFEFDVVSKDILAIQYFNPEKNEKEIVYTGTTIKMVDGMHTKIQFDNLMKKDRMDRVQKELNIAMTECDEKTFKELLEVYKKENPKFPQEFWDRWSAPNEYWEHWKIK
jgi:hypothetical protein